MIGCDPGTEGRMRQVDARRVVQRHTPWKTPKKTPPTTLSPRAEPEASDIVMRWRAEWRPQPASTTGRGYEVWKRGGGRCSGWTVGKLQNRPAGPRACEPPGLVHTPSVFGCLVLSLVSCFLSRRFVSASGPLFSFRPSTVLSNLSLLPSPRSAVELPRVRPPASVVGLVPGVSGSP